MHVMRNHQNKSDTKLYILPIEQKGMTFDHDFGYSFPFNEVAKIVIKSHAFLLDPFYLFFKTTYRFTLHHKTHIFLWIPVIIIISNNNKQGRKRLVHVHK